MDKRTSINFLENGLVSVNDTPSHLLPIIQKNSQTRLLCLPAEIRNQISAYVLGGKKIMMSSYGPRVALMITDGKSVHGHHIHLFFALPRVCRQLYAETALKVYSLNTFTFEEYSSDTDRDAFVAHRKEGHLRAIQSVMIEDESIIRNFNAPSEVLDPFIEIFPNLKKIFISLSRSGQLELIEMGNRRECSWMDRVKRCERGDVAVTAVDLVEEDGCNFLTNRWTPE